jgi:hypothetical protein
MWSKICPSSEDCVTQRTPIKCGPKKLPPVGGLCHTADFDQMWSKEIAPHRRTLSHSRLRPNVVQKLPLIGGLRCTADSDQMWSKNCPSSEDFVAQRTPTKCGPKIAPHRRTLSHSGLRPNVVQKLPLIGGLCRTADSDQMWSKNCPLSEDFVAQRTPTKCGPKIAPHRMTLLHSGLRPNVVQKLPLVGGLCHTTDFDQIWSKKNCPSLEDFVTQRTLTKCGPKIAPRWRTLSHSGLRPNVVQIFAPHWRTLSHSGL